MDLRLYPMDTQNCPLVIESCEYCVRELLRSSSVFGSLIVFSTRINNHREVTLLTRSLSTEMGTSESRKEKGKTWGILQCRNTQSEENCKCSTSLYAQ